MASPGYLSMRKYLKNPELAARLLAREIDEVWINGVSPKCSICTHPLIREINEALFGDGVTTVRVMTFDAIVDWVCSQEGVRKISRGSLSRHQNRHTPMALMKIRPEDVGLRPEAYASRVAEGGPASPESVPDEFSGYVYLIATRDMTFFKIGASTNPPDRLADIQTSNPDRCTLLHYFPCLSLFAAEKKLHEVFSHKKASGDWFQLSREDVAWLLTIDFVGADKINRKTVPDYRVWF